MNYLIYIILGFLPSIIWLAFYLRKDAHPEPNKLVIKIFFYGMLITLPVIFIELGFTKGLEMINFIPFPSIIFSLIEIFIGIAFIEEFSKYLVVRRGILKSPALDEPVDIMIYMIIAALGFAAIENTFLLFSLWQYSLLFPQILMIIFGRFISATFLHALVSGILGYFLALSFFENKKAGNLLLKGLIIAALLHGFYNFSIILIKDPFLKIIIIINLLLVMALFVSFAFSKLKRMPNLYKINKQ